MDFPITLGVVLSLMMSLAETAAGAEHAYFDGAIMLLFFLLIGRMLDQTMRRRTRMLAENLSALRSETAARIAHDGTIRDVPLSAIAPGDLVLVRPGERVAVDGIVETGTSEIDQSLVTGETSARDHRAGRPRVCRRAQCHRRTHGARHGRRHRHAVARCRPRCWPARFSRKRARFSSPTGRRASTSRWSMRRPPSTLFGWLVAGARLARSDPECGRGPDHHLPLRARARHTGRADRRGGRAVPRQVCCSTAATPWSDSPPWIRLSSTRPAR